MAKEINKDLWVGKMWEVEVTFLGDGKFTPVIVLANSEDTARQVAIDYIIGYGHCAGFADAAMEAKTGKVKYLAFGAARDCRVEQEKEEVKQSSCEHDTIEIRIQKNGWFGDARCIWCDKRMRLSPHRGYPWYIKRLWKYITRS